MCIISKGKKNWSVSDDRMLNYLVNKDMPS